MERPLLREQSPAEYFKELVESALSRQHLQAGDLTEYYLVNLLCQYVRLDATTRVGDHDQPLAIRLARALESGGSEQRARLQQRVLAALPVEDRPAEAQLLATLCYEAAQGDLAQGRPAAAVPRLKQALRCARDFTPARSDPVSGSLMPMAK